MSKFQYIPEIGALASGKNVVFLTAVQMAEQSTAKTIPDIETLLTNREKFTINNPSAVISSFSLPHAILREKSIVFDGVNIENQTRATIGHFKAIVQEWEKLNGEIEVEIKAPEPLPVV